MWASHDPPFLDVGAEPSVGDFGADASSDTRGGGAADAWWGDSSVRAVLLTGLAVVAAAVVGGVLIGVLWNALSPAVQAVVGPDSISVSETQTGRIFAGEGVFAALTAAAGTVTAVAAARWVRRAGASAVIGLTLAGLAGSLVAWRTGLWFGPPEVETLTGLTVGDLAEMPLRLRSHGFLLLWPIATVFVTMWISVVSLVMSTPSPPGRAENDTEPPRYEP